jgi:AhpD family alkylhydroperoxidase
MALPLYELFMNTAPWNKFQPLCGLVKIAARRRFSLATRQPRVKWRRYHTRAAGEYNRVGFRNSQRRKSMMMDWNQYHKEVGARIGDLMKVSPDTVRGYQTLSAANSKTSKLGEKTRQLISLAVAVTTHCDGCIVVHTDAALKAGATKEEIAEALGVAVAMNAGAALVYSSRVLDAVEAKSAAAHAD